MSSPAYINMLSDWELFYYPIRGLFTPGEFTLSPTEIFNKANYVRGTTESIVFCLALTAAPCRAASLCPSSRWNAAHLWSVGSALWLLLKLIDKEQWEGRRASAARLAFSELLSSLFSHHSFIRLEEKTAWPVGSQKWDLMLWWVIFW